MKFAKIAVAATALALMSWTAHAIDISGAGATFPYPIYAKWADAYKKETGNGLNYQSIGSGGGIKQIKAKTVTFGATDAPLPGKELDEVGPRPVPDGDGRHRAGREPRGHQARRADARRPDASPRSISARSRAGTMPAIAKLNPNVKLPKQAIVPVRRSDGSGTTYNFAYYLAEVSPEWKSKVGVNTALQWPVGIGAKGNEGVAGNVGADQGLDRLCRVRLRQAEQAHPHQDDQQGRQDGRAELGDLPGRRRQRRLELPAGLRRHPGQPARRPVLADDGRDLDPDVQEAGGCRRRRPRR